MDDIKRIIAVVAAVVVSATVAQAEEKRGHDAHEHGVGKLNIAFEGGAVAMEFSAPGADIVGFEHPAESTGDRAKIKSALAALEKPLSLFRLPEAAMCTLVEASAELHKEDEDHKEHEEHEDKHAQEDQHGKDAKHEDKDEHHRDHKDEDGHDEPSHTEFHAEYRLACGKPKAIDRISFEYFKMFPNAKELDVQMISDKGTKGFEVERDEPTLDLDGTI
ncbi:MAG: DUF2796 domain-containing protein [Proteobacteria bacterium]|jgi:hypothetical protein|nr:DUF2796 domain-containing protein [Pseudomonadota bacterium]MDA1308764.1 DUF2796 domain-containing protein [Pseudomonadota bacterium]